MKKIPIHSESPSRYTIQHREQDSV
jgi:hypothetical protein